MTSNLGADYLARLPEGVPSTAAKGEVMEVVRSHLAPEFINRIDDIVLFNRLSRANMTDIVNVQIGGNLEISKMRDLICFRNARLFEGKANVY